MAKSSTEEKATLSRKGVGGRPSKYTPELADRICEELATGRALTRICKEEDWCPDEATVFRWLARYPEFREKYAEARQLGAERRAVEILAIADEEPMMVTDQNGVTRVDTGWVQWQRLRVDSRKWELSKLLPKKYGDKIDLNHGGQADNPIKHETRVVIVPAKEPSVVETKPLERRGDD